MILKVCILIIPSFSGFACWKIIWKQQTRHPLVGEPVQIYPPVEQELEEESAEEPSTPVLTQIEEVNDKELESESEVTNRAAIQRQRKQNRKKQYHKNQKAREKEQKEQRYETAQEPLQRNIEEPSSSNDKKKQKAFQHLSNSETWKNKSCSKSNKKKEIEMDICAICFDNLPKLMGNDLENPASTLPCGHSFHRECLIGWICNPEGCPTCRQKVSLARHVDARKNRNMRFVCRCEYCVEYHKSTDRSKFEIDLYDEQYLQDLIISFRENHSTIAIQRNLLIPEYHEKHILDKYILREVTGKK